MNSATLNTETANIIREDIQRVKMEIKKMNAESKKARRRGDLQTIIDINTARVDLLDELEELEYALVDAETATEETATEETATEETATEETATEETATEETATEETTETEIKVTFDRERKSATDCRWWVDVNGKTGGCIYAVYEEYKTGYRFERKTRLAGYEVSIEGFENLVFEVTEEISPRKALKNAKAYMTMVLTAYAQKEIATATEETANTETATEEIKIENAIQVIAELTHWNDHSNAVVILARTFGTKTQITEARRISELHNEAKEMSRELLNRRELVKTQIMLSIAKRDLDLYYRVEKAF